MPVLGIHMSECCRAQALTPIQMATAATESYPWWPDKLAILHCIAQQEGEMVCTSPMLPPMPDSKERVANARHTRRASSKERPFGRSSSQHSLKFSAIFMHKCAEHINVSGCRIRTTYDGLKRSFV